MHRLDWADLDTFFEVYRAGSMLDAARALKCNPSTVSRRIAALEQQLGGRLFDRGPGRWAATALAERVAPLVEQMRDRAQRVAHAASDEADVLSGPVTVTAGDAMMRSLLLPALAEFHLSHPKIDLTLLSDDDRIDLGAREADVAVRCTPKPPPDLVGRDMGLATARIYGTQSLVDAAKAGQSVPVLTWVGDGVSAPEWSNAVGLAKGPIVRVNAIGLLLDAARQGLGLALLPCLLADPAPELVRFRPSFSDPGWSIWVLSHSDVRNTARVRAVRDALVVWLAENVDLIAGNRGSSGGIAAE